MRCKYNTITICIATKETIAKHKSPEFFNNELVNKITFIKREQSFKIATKREKRILLNLLGRQIAATQGIRLTTVKKPAASSFQTSGNSFVFNPSHYSSCVAVPSPQWENVGLSPFLNLYPRY